MPSALFNLDLIHALHALHKRIDALEQVTQLHARANHELTRFDVYSLVGIDKRIRYLQKEIRILTGLGRTMGKPNTTQIKQCEDEITYLIQIRQQRVSSGLSTHATGGAHTIKVAINYNVGGFHVSPEGIRLYEQLSGQPFPDHAFHNPFEYRYRTDPYLIRVIETLKDRASASGAELVIKQIPSDINWHIHEYDGSESIYKTVDGADYELTYDGSWRDTTDDSSDQEI